MPDDSFKSTPAKTPRMNVDFGSISVLYTVPTKAINYFRGSIILQDFTIISGPQRRATLWLAFSVSGLLKPLVRSHKAQA